MYYHGEGIAQDHKKDKKAVQWDQKAADQGLIDALFGLAVMYHYGL